MSNEKKMFESESTNLHNLLSSKLVIRWITMVKITLQQNPNPYRNQQPNP